MLAALGARGFQAALEIEPVARACLLLVDGLGWELLLRSRSAAPFLATLAAQARPLTAGFPATTAASLGSVGTGRPPGEHGIVGYTMAIPGHDRALNVLRWALYGQGPHVDLLDELPPEAAQPDPTAFQLAAQQGIEVFAVGPHHLAHTGLTRAIFRGAAYRGTYAMGDLAAEAAAALAEGRRSLVYAYHADLDFVGHLRGSASESWRAQLALVDRLVQELAERLPRDSALVVSGDHGMVDLDDQERVDLDDEPDLKAGVRLLGGEARARHVYAEAGAADALLQAWRARLGDRMWIASREEAIAAGWFGPRVPDRYRARIGDLVAAAFGRVGVFQRAVDPQQSRFVGHHGSMTAEEQLVPFLLLRRA